MPHLAQAIVWPLVWLAAGVVLARDGRPAPEDRPAPARPLRPLTQKDLDRREAQKFYGLGVLHERHDRLLEAVRSFERARKLDPEAAAVHKALVRLYLALRRDQEALAACEKVVSLDPGDFETWYVYGRELKEQNRPKEAIAALTRGLDCPRMKEFPDLILEMSFQLAGLHEEVKDYQAAEAAYRKVAAV
ncbi:MAG TPA: tetratricopeptide repeat protein, partial [Gemmataceae bacterium]|nr:tetratricopeptide repeat protein [Gemmataceae bacterium]